VLRIGIVLLGGSKRWQISSPSDTRTPQPPSKRKRKFKEAGVDEAFQNQVREMLKPGTSALFMVVEQMTTDKAMDALSKYGGTVLKTSLSKEAEKQLQDALHGEQPN
jgi:hypothetical protein